MDALLTNRRGFIRTATKLGVFGTLAASPLVNWAASKSTTLTILHTNDWHSRIEAFPKDGGANQGMGGAAARAALINKIRSECEHVLLLDAGDIFQGTPYFNFFGGELEYKLMTQMGYDVATLGNHDFDNGVEGWMRMLPHAGFSFVNANYDFGKTPMAEAVKPYKIIQKGPLKIGVFGLGIELAGLVPEKCYAGIQHTDPVVAANRISSYLKVTEKCDLIICLSHLGYQYGGTKISDVKLAAQTQYIDLIIGGHTHTFMPQPDTLKNASGNTVMINQVGWAGLQLGRIDYTFEPLKNKGLTANSRLINIGGDNC
jgi:5'-nucleotidase